MPPSAPGLSAPGLILANLGKVFEWNQELLLASGIRILVVDGLQPAAEHSSNDTTSWASNASWSTVSAQQSSSLISLSLDPHLSPCYTCGLKGVVRVSDTNAQSTGELQVGILTLTLGEVESRFSQVEELELFP